MMNTQILNRTKTTDIKELHLPINEVTEALAYRVKIEHAHHPETKNNLRNFIWNYKMAVEKNENIFQVRLLDSVREKLLNDLEDFAKGNLFPESKLSNVRNLLKAQKRLK